MQSSLEFINDMMAHVPTLSYIQIGMFIVVIFLLYFVEHLIHYNATLYGMIAIPGITGASSASSASSSSELKKKRSR